MSSERFVWLPLAALLIGGCVRSAAPRPVILATTTSVQDSGLLDVLLPIFQEETGYRVKPIAVGTGEALAMAERGDADVILAHAPQLEESSIARGSTINRRRVMHNDFLLLGPKEDPARIGDVKDAELALGRIAQSEVDFISRGDNSGTHVLERSLWSEAGIEPAGEWYMESGQGMAATLMIACERDAHTLSDRGTYLSLKNRCRLVPLFEGDPVLVNVYSVLEVNADRFMRVNRDGGRALADFLLSSLAQAEIRVFGIDRLGEPLFYPDAGSMGQEPGT